MIAYLTSMSSWEITASIFTFFDLAILLAVLMLPKNLGFMGMFCSLARHFSNDHARYSVRQDGGRRTYFNLSIMVAAYIGLAMWAYSAGWMFCAWFLVVSATVFFVHTLYALASARAQLRHEMVG